MSMSASGAAAEEQQPAKRVVEDATDWIAETAARPKYRVALVVETPDGASYAGAMSTDTERELIRELRGGPVFLEFAAAAAAHFESSERRFDVAAASRSVGGVDPDEEKRQWARARQATAMRSERAKKK